MKNVVLLDLFSGIGGFPKGLEEAGFNITKHYFSEVDKHAIANYRHNFKNAEYVGSVTDVRGSQLPQRPNIITFGSPCQDFSLAGKRKGMDGERSSLISHAVRLITECRPDVFIWENVKGTFSSNNGADFWAIIQAFANIGGYRVEWQLLNTAWLLPQNRERIYLIGHLGKGSGRFVFPFGEDDKVFAAQRTGGSSEPLPCITATEHKGPSKQRPQNLVLQVKSATTKGYETATEGDSINLSQPDSETRRGRVGKGKANTLETSCNQAVVCAAMRGRNPENPSSRKKGDHFEQTLEVNENGTTNTLTAVQKDNLIIQMNPSKESGGNQPYQQNRVYDDKGHVPALCSQMSSGTHAIRQINPDAKHQQDRVYSEDGIAPQLNAGTHGNAAHLTKTMVGARIRRLTEIECERLQGFPDNWTKWGLFTERPTRKDLLFREQNPELYAYHTKAVTDDNVVLREISRTQRYKMCGNAVTKDVVEMIGKRLIEVMKP